MTHTKTHKAQSSLVSRVAGCVALNEIARRRYFERRREIEINVKKYKIVKGYIDTLGHREKSLNYLNLLASKPGYFKGDEILDKVCETA
jgi:hypothetical protein